MSSFIRCRLNTYKTFRSKKFEQRGENTMNEIKFEQLKEMLLYKKITEWDNNEITLSDGTLISVEETVQDCCSSAGGTFKDVKLDAVITDVLLGDVVTTDIGWGESEAEVTMKIFHNQDIVALMEASANDGNGGYYYSVASLVIKKVGNETYQFDVVDC